MKHLTPLLLLTAVACGGGDAPPSGTDPAAVAGADTTKVTAAATGTLPPKKPKPIVDTGVVAAPADLVRETYGYTFKYGSRDPFRGIVNLADGGPELPDLVLGSVIYNHTDPKLSLVTFREIGNKKQYTIHPGDRIGRLVLVSVDTEEATLRVNDYGTIREMKYTLRRTEDRNP